MAIQMALRRIIAPMVRVSHAPPAPTCHRKAAKTATVYVAMAIASIGAQPAPRHRPIAATT